LTITKCRWMVTVKKKYCVIDKPEKKTQLEYNYVFKLSSG